MDLNIGIEGEKRNEPQKKYFYGFTIRALSVCKIKYNLDPNKVKDILLRSLSEETKKLIEAIANETREFTLDRYVRYIRETLDETKGDESFVDSVLRAKLIRFCEKQLMDFEYGNIY